MSDQTASDDDGDNTPSADERAKNAGASAPAAKTKRNAAAELSILPAEIEEDLAETVGHMIRRGMLPGCGLGKTLCMIATEVGLDAPYLEIVSDPEWIQAFADRWAHKICQHDTTPTSSSIPLRPAKKHPPAVMGATVHEEGQLAIRCSNSGPEHCTPPVLDEALLDGKGLAVKVDVHTVDESPERSGFSPDDTHTDFEFLEVKRMCMGLRGTIKPVDRLQYPAGVSPKKKKLKDVNIDRSEMVTSDSKSDESSFVTDDESSPQKKWQTERKRSAGPSKMPHAMSYTDLQPKVVITRSDQGTEVVEIAEFDGNSDMTSGSNENILEQKARSSKRGRHRRGPRRTVKTIERLQSTAGLEERAKKRRHHEDDYLQIVSSGEDCFSSSDETSISTGSRRKPRYEEDNDKGRANFELVHAGITKLKDLCLACGTTKNIKANHPLFIGGLCEEHKIMLHEWFFKYDSDGYHSCCSVCCMGDKVVLCDVRDCGRCYCKQCLDTLVGRGCFDNAVRLAKWICYFCKDSTESLLRQRPEWQEEIQRLYESTCESRYPPFPVPQPIPVQHRQPIRVLSLFDGIATGVVALKQLGLEIGGFVASEIDEDAIRLVQNKHSEVIHIGDITKVTDEQIFKMGPFDLLLGGSPCNDLSGANPKRRGLIDAEGSGCLFFDFYRILRTVEPPREADGQRQRPFFWLFENVVSMKGIEKERISRFLQCEPKMADARYVSAAARPRLFWGNLPGLRDRHVTPGVKDRLSVQDCLEPGREAKVKKLNTITTKYTCLYQGRGRQAPVLHHGKDDVLWTTELERVFGVPEHYTDVNNLGPRERLALLGRSWSVPVVRLLLAPLKEYFSGVQQQLAEQKLSSASWWS